MTRTRWIGGIAAALILVAIGVVKVANHDDGGVTTQREGVPSEDNASENGVAPSADPAEQRNRDDNKTVMAEESLEAYPVGWNRVGSEPELESYASYAVAAGPGGFVEVVATGLGDALLVRQSSDGVRWETRLTVDDLPRNFDPRQVSVIANDNGYVVIDGRGGHYSPDGLEWLPVPFLQSGASVATDAEFVVVEAADGELVTWRSSDGVTWSGAGARANQLPRPGLIDRRDPLLEGAATDGHSIVVAVAETGVQEFGYLWRSLDGGRHWHEVFASPVNDYIFGVTHGPGGYVAVGWSANLRTLGVSWASLDGRTWVRREMSEALPDDQWVDLVDVVSNDEGYFAIGLLSDGGAAAGGFSAVEAAGGWFSVDGLTWELVPPTAGNRATSPLAVSSVGDMFVVRGWEHDADRGLLAVGWFVVLPPRRGPGITLEPAGDVALGLSTLRVTGAGWDTPTVSLLPCRIPESGDLVDLTSRDCILMQLTDHLVSDDGDFSVEVPFAVPPGGLVIAAGNQEETVVVAALVTADLAAPLETVNDPTPDFSQWETTTEMSQDERLARVRAFSSDALDGSPADVATDDALLVILETTCQVAQAAAGAAEYSEIFVRLRTEPALEEPFTPVWHIPSTGQVGPDSIGIITSIALAVWCPDVEIPRSWVRQVDWFPWLWP